MKIFDVLTWMQLMTLPLGGHPIGQLPIGIWYPRFLRYYRPYQLQINNHLDGIGHYTVLSDDRLQLPLLRQFLKKKGHKKVKKKFTKKCKKSNGHKKVPQKKNYRKSMWPPVSVNEPPFRWLIEKCENSGFIQFCRDKYHEQKNRKTNDQWKISKR